MRSQPKFPIACKLTLQPSMLARALVTKNLDLYYFSIQMDPVFDYSVFVDHDHCLYHIIFVSCFSSLTSDSDDDNRPSKNENVDSIFDDFEFEEKTVLPTKEQSSIFDKRQVDDKFLSTFFSGPKQDSESKPDSKKVTTVMTSPTAAASPTPQNTSSPGTFINTVTSEYPTSTLASKWSKRVRLSNGQYFEWFPENWAKNVYFVVKNVWFLNG